VAALLPDTNAAALEYIVADQATYLLVLWREPAAPDPAAEEAPPTHPVNIKVYRIDTTRKELAERIARFRQAIPLKDARSIMAARELYDQLVAPAAVELRNRSALVIVPDGPLWDLPFEALQAPDEKYLIESSRITLAVSLAALNRAMNIARQRDRHGDTPRRLLAVANPAVPENVAERLELQDPNEELGASLHAEREVAVLAGIYGRESITMLAGIEAREDVIRLEAPRHHVLHLAAPAALNDMAPMFSRVALSKAEKAEEGDGLLQPRELIEWELDADVVILSRCRTGRTPPSTGAGFIGLSWSLLVAGAPATVVTRWRVDGPSTTLLVRDLHRALVAGFKADDSSPAGALRRAVQALRTSKEYRHPYYWSGFTTIGP
jgi:CHAT domain-containing protein